MFTQGHLTRGQGHDPRRMLFAVLDISTTGYEPARGDRIHEVAVVRMRGDGTVVDEYSTLVNPQRPVPYDEHSEITDAQVGRAPTFDRIAGDLLAYLSDAVVVAHNLDHEDRFLDSELRRLGIRATDVPGLCTLRLMRTQLDTFPYKGRHLYRLMTGDWPAWNSNALANARQRAHMLRTVIDQSPVPLSWTGPDHTALPAVARTGVIAPHIVGLRKGEEGWLANLVASLPDMNPSPRPNPQGAAAYRSMLGHALADGKIVGEEAHQLAELATAAGFTQATIRQVHEQVLLEARSRAEADGVVTTAELRELEKAAKALGEGHAIQDLLHIARKEKERRNGPLKGWRIVPVGESAAISAVVEHAVAQGATVGVNVSKTVRLVIAEEEADPKVQQALQAGHQVVTPAQAWEVLKAASYRADRSLFEDGESAQVAARMNAEREERAAEGQQPWQACWRPRELTEREYHREFVAPHAARDRVARQAVPQRQAASRQAVPRQAVKQQKGGGCAGAALLFMATGTAATVAASGVWPF
ncbi:PolC-type DNA polymerase III [Nocardiopsis tropica]|uniref:3'-5' exonuclease n=1 Tax=Nocardiopsis tropica TaxID=109330 RepID=A0ABV2A3G6_9ACTN